MSEQYNYWMSMMQLAEVAQNWPPPLWQMPGVYRLAIKATAEYFGQDEPDTYIEIHTNAEKYRFFQQELELNRVRYQESE